MAAAFQIIFMDNWWPLHPRKWQNVVKTEGTKGQCHKVTDLRFIWNLGEREPQRENPWLPCGRWGSASQGRKTRHPGGASWCPALGGVAHVVNWSETGKASSSALWNFLILCLLILILQLTHLICFVMVLTLCMFVRRYVPLFWLFLCVCTRSNILCVHRIKQNSNTLP